jgi:hypothetical protein
MRNIATVSQNEKRYQPRLETQTFVRIQVRDDEELETMLGLTQDCSDQGLAILTYFPLPIGTRVTVTRDEDCVADAEVTAWEWDYNCNMARMGLFLVKKSPSWLIKLIN